MSGHSWQTVVLVAAGRRYAHATSESGFKEAYKASKVSGPYHAPARSFEAWSLEQNIRSARPAFILVFSESSMLGDHELGANGSQASVNSPASIGPTQAARWSHTQYFAHRDRQSPHWEPDEQSRSLYGLGAA